MSIDPVEKGVAVEPEPATAMKPGESSIYIDRDAERSYGESLRPAMGHADRCSAKGGLLCAAAAMSGEHASADAGNY